MANTTVGPSVYDDGCHASAQSSTMAVATMGPAVQYGSRHKWPIHPPWRPPQRAEPSYMAVAISQPTHFEWQATIVGSSVYEGSCHASAQPLTMVVATMGPAVQHGGHHKWSHPSTIATTMGRAVLHGSRHSSAHTSTGKPLGWPIRLHSAHHSGPSHLLWQSPYWAHPPTMAVTIMGPLWHLP